MYRFILFIICVSTTINFAQMNVDLVGQRNQYPSVGYNDIWGYVDPSGNEYALLGVQSGTSIISLVNPQNPVEVAFIPGPNSLWRDIKTHSHYAYVVTEGTSSGTGMQVIDLSQLPVTATLVHTFSTTFTSAHNIFIDDGYAYVIGTNSGGMHIIDLSNPTAPVQVGYYGGSGYVHDVYAWEDTVVVCAGSSQRYAFINVSNKSNPVMISQSSMLPGIYSHSGWMTEDKNYFIGCEEFDTRDVTVWDVSDRTSWDLVVNQWQMTNPTPQIDDPVHNLFVKGNFAHISYYKHGYVVLDISNPLSPQLAGNYDTYPGSNGVYAGAWGCYPYLPSGNILISDMQTGLWVFDFLLDGTTPVELESFSASVALNEINLTWATASELNNQGFNIERSNDNVNWVKIGFVEGAGTSSEKNTYTFSDRSPIEAKSFYRLTQIDYDGTKHFSQSIEVVFYSVNNFSLKQNYPNPFNPSTKIAFTLLNDDFTNLSIYNVLGEKVKEIVNEQLSAGSYEFNFDAVDLPSGLYIANLKSGSDLKSIKMNLLK
ncbi:MAG: choice-of-anchor B family protein [Ignavibacteriales bacterium]|nr:MAG: choice-of-anchor B family protein [Ignavibacteriales bacterium]